MKLCKNLVLTIMAMALVLCLCALPQTAQAAGESNLTFKLNEEGTGYVVTGCDRSASGDLVIPETYNSLPVTAIGDWAFQSCEYLTGVVIPESVTSIGYLAFDGCYNLRYNDYDYGKYLGSANNPYFALVAAERQDIRYCTIHPDTRIISGAAFYRCTNLESFGIRYGVTNIGYGAFYGCTALTEIYLSDSITAIGDFAFAGCTALADISIPNSVTSIGPWAFNQCSAMTSITLPSGITTISEGMLAMCSSLTEVSIPSGVTAIGIDAFNGCTSLTTITIPNGATAIGEGAFSWCSRLSSINIPQSVTGIGAGVFSNCGKLETVIYCGTQEQWNAIDVSAYNEVLSQVRFHNFENGVCTYCQATETVACNHNWKDADCENPKTCTLCQKTEGAALGHNMQETAGVDPTCETAGKTATFTCANGCGKTEGGEEIPAIGHNMQETAGAVAATCETAGKNATLTCANGCGKTEGGEEIPATGHQLENGVCTVCGYDNLTAGDIDGNGIVDQDDVVYLLLNTMFGEERYPISAAADIDSNGTIDQGDVVYLLLHTMFGDKLYPLNGGTGCGNAGHSWMDATCTAPKTCSACGATEGSALDHNFANGVCTGCGVANLSSSIDGKWFLEGLSITEYEEEGYIHEEYERWTLVLSEGTASLNIAYYQRVSDEDLEYVDIYSLAEYNGAYYSVFYGTSGNGTYTVGNDGVIEFNITHYQYETSQSSMYLKITSDTTLEGIDIEKGFFDQTHIDVFNDGRVFKKIG